jgi:putative spermidine/putrescine transport system ATP-binding protein
MTTETAPRTPATAAGTRGGLSIRRISKIYGELRAVDAVDLSVSQGEFLTLLGPSGSGKTTVLMMIAGFVQPSSGEILLDGRPITNLLPERRNFGMVFQGYALFPHLTVAENVAFPLRARRVPREEIATRVRDALAQVQLERFTDRLPRQLSGGQQQRVALARAMVFSPELMLLDEPLSALDKRLRSDLQGELKQLHRRLGRTFINVTHDQEEALAMSDRIAIMRDGRVVQLGRPHDLYERPATRFVADFLGKSNFISGTVETSDRTGFRYSAGGTSFQQVAAEPPPKGSAVLLALRPEKMAIHAGRPANGVNAVAAEIVSLSYAGSALHLVLRSAELGELMLTTPTWRAETSPEPGLSVWLSWAPDAATIVAED